MAALSSTFAAGGLPAETISPQAAAADAQKTLRLLIYLYVLLWVFEGALRKWIVPGLSGPLLIVRDPILLAIYFTAFRKKILFFDPFTASILLLGLLSTIVSLGLPVSPPLGVVAFGFRANFFHLPLIFLLPRVLSYRHVRFLGVLFLWIAVPMAVLVTLQFLAPSMGHLNAGAGGNEGGMLETAGGRIRPSGTFSFTNGMAGFSALIGALLLHQVLERAVFPKLAFLAAAPSLLVLVLLSGSRTTFGLIVLLFLTVLAIWVVQPRYMRSSIKFFAIGFVVVALVGSFSVLKVGISVLAERFGDKKNVREGFVMRFAGEFAKPFLTATRAEPFGVGIGMGTNAASSIIYGKVRFNFGESDWDRIINEMGPLLGLLHIFWRLVAALFLLRESYLALRRDGNTLPLLLCTAGLPDLMLGQLGQATTLGFVCLTGGLALAATRREEEPETLASPESATLHAGPASTPSRSPYSQRLIPDEMRVAAPAVAPGTQAKRGRSSYSEMMLLPQDEIAPLQLVQRGRRKASPMPKRPASSKPRRGSTREP